MYPEYTWKYIGIIMVGYSSVILFWLTPSSVLRKIGDKIIPSFISILHAPLAWIGYIIYLSGLVFTGVIIIYIAAAMDLLDGLVSRELKKRDKELGIEKEPPKTILQAFFFKGESELGGVIDSTMDKVTIFLIYFHIAYSFFLFEFTKNRDDVYLVSIVLIMLILLTDTVGGSIRSDPVYRLLKESGFDVIKRANWIGKVKSLMQFIWLSVYFPIHQKWVLSEYVTGWVWFLNGFLLVIFTFGVASVVTKLTRKNVNNI